MQNLYLAIAFFYSVLVVPAAIPQTTAPSNAGRSGPKGLCPLAKTQADLNDCFSKAARSSDTKMRALYDRYLGLLSGQDKSNLQEAQAAWLLYRDAECKAYAGGTQSSGYAMQFDSCISDLTLARVRELRGDYGSVSGH
jgi:uncharacterized protein YecT (DUF1311 family)